MTDEELKAYIKNAIVPDIINMVETGPVEGNTFRSYVIRENLFEIKIYDRRKNVLGRTEGVGDAAKEPIQDQRKED